MDLLIFLVQRPGELVSRDEIAERLWGKDVFLDVDHSINVAIRKIRTVLRDDPEKPRFVETVIGRGYRFAAPVVSSNGDSKGQAQTLPTPAQAAPGTPVLPAAAPPKKKGLASPRMLLGGLAVLLLLLGVSWVLIRGGGAQSAAKTPIRSIAVLPLKNLSARRNPGLPCRRNDGGDYRTPRPVARLARYFPHLGNALQEFTALRARDC